MAIERFLDTNILLYGYDLDAVAKRGIALALIEDGWHLLGRTAISVQVLQEFHVNFTRRGHPASEAATLTGDFSLWPVIDNSHNATLWTQDDAFQHLPNVKYFPKRKS
ncbi:MAG: hypothetical protein WCO57_02665 [Verrucomicrobiota bacterium]